MIDGATVWADLKAKYEALAELHNEALAVDALGEGRAFIVCHHDDLAKVRQAFGPHVEIRASGHITPGAAFIVQKVDGPWERDKRELALRQVLGTMGTG